MKGFFLLGLVSIFFSVAVRAQMPKQKFNHLDTLFGSNTPQRSWWDVQRYDVAVTPDFDTKTITGKTTITYTVLTDVHNDYLQVDLQKPLQIDSIFYNGKMYINYPGRPYYNEGNHWFIPLPKAPKGSEQSLSIVYHGKPKEAVNAPWEGGFIWARDKQNRPWITVACEGDGASVWYPCKDLWSDEPDKGATLTVTVPSGLTAVGNGRLKSKTSVGNKTIFAWEVTAPINSYNIIPYIGHYQSWSDTLSGEKGSLDLTYWVLDYDRKKAEEQFVQVKPMLRAFEYWFGPYPFYADGYQLVEAPHLGMEHQSAVAYGNQFRNGYLGSDMSGTGWGLGWDYIIVHESGHEWFGNNITAKDNADMWVHEGFTDYSETIYVGYYYGEKAANEYVQGIRPRIQNREPIIGPYGVHRDGSGDMYFKGANMIHTIRQVIDNDETFRQILRGLNSEFYHQTVSSRQVEEYISRKSGKDFSTVFDQYLRTIKIPVLEYSQSGGEARFRWTNTVPAFNLPVRLTNGQWIKPTAAWQKVKLLPDTVFAVDKNFYINVKKV